MSIQKPLNYSTEFIDWWRRNRNSARGRLTTNVDIVHTFMLYDVFCDLASKAQHFMLPKGGRLMEGGTMLAKYSPLLRLPFPITAFEYEPVAEKALPQTIATDRRISLCVDAATFNSLGGPWPTIALNEWLCFSLFRSTTGVWAFAPGFSVLNDARTTVIEGNESIDAVESLKEFLPNAKPLKPGTEVLVSEIGRFFDSVSLPQVQADLSDEVIAAVQACATLNCENVDITSIHPPKDLNARRLKKGKAPLFSYHILECSTDNSCIRRDLGGTHASPRAHIRRGHIRRLSDIRSTWVRHAIISSSSSGVVSKDYRIAS